MPYVFIDQNIEIKQIQVKNLNRFAQFAEPIKKLESYSIETIAPLIETNMIQIMGIFSIVTTLVADSFIERKENIEAIADLVLKIIQVNEDFFKKEPKGENSKDSSWFNAISYLVKHGHSEEDVLNMSYGAFLKYIKEAQAIERQQIKSYAIATRVANHAKQQAWEKYLKQLD